MPACMMPVSLGTLPALLRAPAVASNATIAAINTVVSSAINRLRKVPTPGAALPSCATNGDRITSPTEVILGPFHSGA